MNIEKSINYENVNQNIGINNSNNTNKSISNNQ